MKTFLSSRLIPSLAAGITSQLVRGASAVQHLCMKTAVAVDFFTSKKYVWFVL